MKIRQILAILLSFVLSGAICQAGNELSIRLVKASETAKGGVDVQLSDVGPLLKKTLSYNTYRLIATGAQDLPTNGGTLKLGDLGISCRGKQSKLHLSVTKDKKELLKTDVSLRAGKPFIVGGLPSSGKDKLLLIFLIAK
jgi:hypothetical protein